MWVWRWWISSVAAKFLFALMLARQDLISLGGNKLLAFLAVRR